MKDNENLTLRLPPGERGTIEAAANLAGKSLARFIREAALAKARRTTRPLARRSSDVGSLADRLEAIV
jgi:uncharacterized protein (DUF1778 family)